MVIHVHTHTERYTAIFNCLFHGSIKNSIDVFGITILNHFIPRFFWINNTSQGVKCLQKCDLNILKFQPQRLWFKLEIN